MHILAGIYFKLEKRELGGDLEATLSGYMRVGGEMSVLVLIAVSVEFLLSFTYYPRKATGRATLTVKVEIAFFTVSVELSVERSFGKDGGYLVFDQMLPAPSLWAEYAAAFAGSPPRTRAASEKYEWPLYRRLCSLLSRPSR